MRHLYRCATRAAGIAFAMMLLASGCGSGGDDPLQIGLRRVALDLAFKGDGAEAEAAPEPVRALDPLDIPSQAEFSVIAPRNSFQIAPGRTVPPPPTACPKAPEGAVPAEPVPVRATKPPLLGVYPTHREGTFSVEGGAFPVRGPMPPQGQKLVSNLQDVTANPSLITPDPPKAWTFDISETVGENTTIRTLRANDAGIDLMQQVTKDKDGETVFRPSPAVRLFRFGVENEEWRSAGTDTASGTSMVVEGRILKREWVDACGTVYDTYVAQSSERIANLRQGYSSVTADALNDPINGGEGKPNYYYVANHYGGLFIQEEIHTVTQAGALTIKLDYTTTFDTVTPEPLPQ